MKLLELESNEDSEHCCLLAVSKVSVVFIQDISQHVPLSPFTLSWLAYLYKVFLNSYPSSLVFASRVLLSIDGYECRSCSLQSVIWRILTDSALEKSDSSGLFAEKSANAEFCCKLIDKCLNDRWLPSTK